jgi:hypothetical protein
MMKNIDPYNSHALSTAVRVEDGLDILKTVFE